MRNAELKSRLQNEFADYMTNMLQHDKAYLFSHCREIAFYLNMNDYLKDVGIANFSIGTQHELLKSKIPILDRLYSFYLHNDTYCLSDTICQRVADAYDDRNNKAEL